MTFFSLGIMVEFALGILFSAKKFLMLETSPVCYLSVSGSI